MCVDIVYYGNSNPCRILLLLYTTLLSRESKSFGPTSCILFHVYYYFNVISPTRFVSFIFLRLIELRGKKQQFFFPCHSFYLCDNPIQLFLNTRPLCDVDELFSVHLDACKILKHFFSIQIQLVTPRALLTKKVFSRLPEKKQLPEVCFSMPKQGQEFSSKLRMRLVRNESEVETKYLQINDEFFKVQGSQLFGLFYFWLFDSKQWIPNPWNNILDVA